MISSTDFSYDAESTSISQLEDYVKNYMINYDCSHDWLHVERVRRMARKLAEAEAQRSGASVNLDLVDLTALLHDIGDSKYSTVSSRELINGLLSELAFAPDIIEQVCFIVENVSFGRELEHRGKGTADAIYRNNIELCCVQDADRLDALGAIGIARCLAFSGARNRPIYDPNGPPIPVFSASEYKQQTALMKGTALNHVHEKLLLLEGMMKTEFGKELARNRTEFIKLFIMQLKGECGIEW